MGREAQQRMQTLVNDRIAETLRDNLVIVDVRRRRVRLGSIEVAFGAAAAVAGGRTYLPCTITNNGAKPAQLVSIDADGLPAGQASAHVPARSSIEVTLAFASTPRKESVVRFRFEGIADLVTRPFR